MKIQLSEDAVQIISMPVDVSDTGYTAMAEIISECRWIQEIQDELGCPEPDTVLSYTRS